MLLHVSFEKKKRSFYGQANRKGLTFPLPLTVSLTVKRSFFKDFPYVISRNSCICTFDAICQMLQITIRLRFFLQVSSLSRVYEFALL